MYSSLFSCTYYATTEGNRSENSAETTSEKIVTFQNSNIQADVINRFWTIPSFYLKIDIIYFVSLLCVFFSIWNISIVYIVIVYIFRERFSNSRGKILISLSISMNSDCGVIQKIVFLW